MPSIVVRHAPTALNAESGTSASDCLRGWADIPLTPDGKLIADQCARQLASQPITHIYTTDLQRGRDTAACISRCTGAPFSEHKELRPWHYGSLTGTPTPTALPVLEELSMHPTVPAPGGGESFAQFLKRFLLFALPITRQPGLTAIVTHGRNVKALEAYLAAHGQGLDMETWRSAPLIGPGGAMLVDSTSTTHLF